MYRILRAESLRAVRIRIILLAALTVALLGVSGSGLLRLIAGPADLYSLGTGELKGKYVSFDASRVIVACASLSTSSDSGKTVLETYYLLPVGDGQYMCVMDKKEHNANVLNRAMEQSHAYYMEDLETLTPLGKISGMVTEMDADMPGYMVSCIEQYDLPGYVEGEDTERLIVPYQIVLDKVSFLPRTLVIVFGAAALLGILLLILQLAAVLSGGYQKKVRAVIGDRETDFDTAQVIERVRVGEYVWFPKGPGSRCLETGSLIWGYALPEPMVVSKYRWPVALYDTDQKLTRITFMEQKNCEAFLEAIEERADCFRVGYSSQAAEQFGKGAESFMKKTRELKKQAKQ